jgi:hypothetical protein
MKYIVDRIESGYAVCELESGRFSDLPLNEIPKVKAGDVLVERNGKIIVDETATEERRRKIISLQNDLWE